MSSSWKMFLRIWTKDLEQPFFRRTLRIQSMDIRSKVSRPSGLGADGSGRKRSPGRGVASAGTGKAQTLRNFTRGYHCFHYGSRRRNITQLAVSLNPRPPPECHLAFPLLFVGAAGDEGDTVQLGHPTILTGLVIERTGSPGDAPPYVLFPAFYELPLRPSC